MTRREDHERVNSRRALGPAHINHATNFAFRSNQSVAAEEHASAHFPETVSLPQVQQILH